MECVSVLQLERQQEMDELPMFIANTYQDQQLTIPGDIEVKQKFLGQDQPDPVQVFLHALPFCPFPHL
jgi:hypothetical protein